MIIFFENATATEDSSYKITQLFLAMSGDEHWHLVLHAEHNHHDHLHGDDNNRQHLGCGDEKHIPVDTGEPLGG